MSEWQPIETAPKDGTVVIILHGNLMAIAFADPENEGVWTLDDGHDYRPACRRELTKPTHWMPLPSPPETRPNDEESKMKIVMGLRYIEKSIPNEDNPKFAIRRKVLQQLTTWVLSPDISYCQEIRDEAAKGPTWEDVLLETLPGGEAP